MHRHLLAGTSLVAAVMFASGGAVAADKKMASKPSISVGGYYDQLIGGVIDEEQKVNGKDMAPDTSGLDVRTDAEIYFNGKATLDNGMKIAARWQLEGQQDADHIDEYFLSVAGSFGKIILGGQAGAPVLMLTGLSGSWATGVGDTLAFDSDDWVPSVAGNFPTLQHSRLDNGDGDKATYISPKFGGFQLGVTYDPTPGEEGQKRVDVGKAVHDGFDVAASYSGTFGDVGFGIGAGVSTAQGANDGGEDRQAWLVAGKISFGGGFTLAAAYKQTDDPMPARGQLADVGVRFVTGANRFSLTGAVGEMDDTSASYSAVMGSYARVLGPGVSTHLNLMWNESESADGMKENTGTAMTTGLKVIF